MCIFAPPCKLCNTVMILIKMQTKDVPPVDLVPPLKGKSPCLNKLACICFNFPISFFVLCPSLHWAFEVTFMFTRVHRSGRECVICLHACMPMSLSDHNLKVRHIYFYQVWKDFKIDSTKNSRPGFNIRLRSKSLIEVNRQICFHDTVSSLVTYVS